VIREDELAEVAVGAVSVPAAIYRDQGRDDGSRASGIRLEHPVTGRWLFSDGDLPDQFYAAGARMTAIVGLPYHPDAQRSDFGLGQLVRLIPEPTNPVNHDALAVRSWNGRFLGGYVPDDDLPTIRAAHPAADVGLVVWERWTLEPWVRRSIRLLVGPVIGLRLVPEADAPDERARREILFAAGTEAERAEDEAARHAAHDAKAAARELERERRHAERVAEHEAKVARAEAWRAAGLCVECGATVEATTESRGRPPIRCETHRHHSAI
jgi:hypothetical protein